MADDRDEPLISSGDLARRLGVSVGTISRWVREDVLVPAFTTVGGRHRFLWSQTQEQLRRHREAGGDA